MLYEKLVAVVGQTGVFEKILVIVLRVNSIGNVRSVEKKKEKTSNEEIDCCQSRETETRTNHMLFLV